MANTKTVEIEVKAKDNASKVLEWVANKSKSFADKIQENLWAIRIASWAIATWFFAMWKKMVSSASEFNTSLKTMNEMLKNTWHSTDEQIKSLNNLISAQSKVWVVSTKVNLAAAKQFATFDMSAEAIAKILPAFDDYIAWEKWMNATTDDAIQLANGLAKALQGNFSSLTKAWWVIDEETASLLANWNEMERAEGLVKVLNSTYKDLNTTLADTTEWRLKNLNSQINSIWATLGQALIPVAEKVIEVITPIVSKVADRIKANPELTATIFTATTAVAWLTFVLTSIIPVFTTLLATISWPAWIIYAVWLLIAWLYTLDSKLKTNEEKIADYRVELEQLTIDYQNWKIPLEEYTQRTQELNAMISECEEKHRTLWWYISDNFISTLHSIMHPMDENNGWLRAWIDLLEMLWGWINSVAKTIGDVLIVALDKVVWKMKELRDWAVKVANKISEFAWGAISSATSWVKDKLSWFANWWSVQGNVPILVWERWPEVFVPSSNWTIIPNNQIAGSTINVNISWVSVRNENDITSLAQEMIRQIKLEKNFWIA